MEINLDALDQMYKSLVTLIENAEKDYEKNNNALKSARLEQVKLELAEAETVQKANENKATEQQVIDIRKDKKKCDSKVEKLEGSIGIIKSNLQSFNAQINSYFKGISNSDPELQQIISNKMEKKYDDLEKELKGKKEQVERIKGLKKSPKAKIPKKIKGSLEEVLKKAAEWKASGTNEDRGKYLFALEELAKKGVKLQDSDVDRLLEKQTIINEISSINADIKVLENIKNRTPDDEKELNNLNIKLQTEIKKMLGMSATFDPKNPLDSKKINKFLEDIKNGNSLELILNSVLSDFEKEDIEGSLKDCQTAKATYMANRPQPAQTRPKIFGRTQPTQGGNSQPTQNPPQNGNQPPAPGNNLPVPTKQGLFSRVKNWFKQNVMGKPVQPTQNPPQDPTQNPPQDPTQNSNSQKDFKLKYKIIDDYVDAQFKVGLDSAKTAREQQQQQQQQQQQNGPSR